MRILFILLLTVYFNDSLSQSLNVERVRRIKESTVRIFAGKSTGTGFFVDSSGMCATCLHVVYPAIDSKAKIFIQFSNGELIEVKKIDFRKVDQTKNEAFYDYCLLVPIKPLNRKTPFLKIGSYDDVQEGAEIYTCGYPFGSSLQFVTRGILSTKYTAPQSIVSSTEIVETRERNQALMDITLNKGNSGGAIVKVGASMFEDEIIGIADFIITPLQYEIDSTIASLSYALGTSVQTIIDSNGRIMSKNDPVENAILIYSQLSKFSVGISGCVSVEYLRAVVRVPHE